MPLYEYHCKPCGDFSAMRPMAESALPSPCPACGKAAERILSATFGGDSRRQKRSHSREPRLVRRSPVAEMPSKKSTPEKKAKRPHHHGRPWMMGH
ncbi:MAG: zinc ribbon domain-containing protein [Deltaproteobacteria bacterium]|nr:zinc ribbon domain-containing protein [Deltaproteobacteria bacterium]